MNTNRFSPLPPDFKTLYVFGAGGHGREIAWLASQTFGDAIKIIHLVDQEKYLQDNVNGNPVKLLVDIQVEKTDRFILALGDIATRKLAANACTQKGLMPVTLVHPRVAMSERIDIGLGSVLCVGCILTTNISIGQHVHINIGSTISHDVRIGDFSTISPGAHISGHVHIGRDVFIGTGANIINGKAGEPLIIGDGAVVAAGACVIRPVAPATMVAGVPAVQKSLAPR
jgi:sugar O-acyltransferase (sialic acid O-acetyltransferase NeuD family)